MSNLPNLSSYRTAHQLARDLLALPDRVVVLPTPSFETPATFVAFPACCEIGVIQGVEVVTLQPDTEALRKSTDVTPDEAAPENKTSAESQSDEKPAAE